jgi:hypothetical protein
MKLHRLFRWRATVQCAANAYSGEDDRLFRRNVTGDSGEVAL